MAFCNTDLTTRNIPNADTNKDKANDARAVSLNKVVVLSI